VAALSFVTVNMWIRNNWCLSNLACFKLVSWHFPEGLRRSTLNFGHVNGVTVEIQSRKSPDYEKINVNTCIFVALQWCTWELHFWGYHAKVPKFWVSLVVPSSRVKCLMDSSLHILSPKKSPLHCHKMSCTRHPRMQRIIQEEWRPKN
jgi:hypothetical protein